MLDLLRPIYEKTAAYGHFGREEPEFTWERTDKAAALRAASACRAAARQRGASVGEALRDGDASEAKDRGAACLAA